MNISRVRLGSTAALLTPALLFVYVAQAQVTAAPADPATALSDAGPGKNGDDADAGPPPLPAFDLQPFPEEKSPRPKKDDWKAVPEVKLSEGSMSSGGSCKLQRLREWVRIFCTTTTAKITLICGDPEDVYVMMGQVPADWGIFPEEGEIVFPVRKGDRRLFEWQGVEFGYKGANTAVNFLVISELWLPWEEKPVIVAR